MSVIHTLIIYAIIVIGTNALESPNFSLGTFDFATYSQGTQDLSSNSFFTSNAGYVWTATAVDGTVSLAAAAPWLTFTPPATLSGTPLTTSSPLVVWITGTSGDSSVSASVLITIDGVSPPLAQCGSAGGPPNGITLDSCTGKSTKEATVHKPYQLKLPSGLISGSSLSYSAYVMPTNATWLKFDTTNLVLFGTPDDTTSATVIVTATAGANGAQSIVHIPISVNDGSSSHTGAIVGAVIGGVAGLLLIGGLLFLYFKRRRHEPKDDHWDEKSPKVHLAGNSESTLLDGKDLQPEPTVSPQMAYLGPSPNSKNKHQNSIRSVNNYVTESAAHVDSRYLVAAAPLSVSGQSNAGSRTGSHTASPTAAVDYSESIPTTQSTNWYKSLRGSMSRIVPAAVAAMALKNGARQPATDKQEKELPPIAQDSLPPPNMLPPVHIAMDTQNYTPLAEESVVKPEKDLASLYTNSSNESVNNILSEYSETAGRGVNSSKLHAVSDAAVTTGLITPSITPVPLVNDDVANDDVVNDNVINDDVVSDNLISDDVVNPNLINDNVVNDEIIAQKDTKPVVAIDRSSTTNSSRTGNYINDIIKRRPSAFSNTTVTRDLVESETKLTPLPPVSQLAPITAEPVGEVVPNQAQSLSSDSFAAVVPKNSPRDSLDANEARASVADSSAFCLPVISEPKMSSQPLDENGVIALAADEGWSHSFSKIINASAAKSMHHLTLHSSLKRSLSRGSRRSSINHEANGAHKDSEAAETIDAQVNVGLQHIDPSTGYTLIYESPSWLSFHDGIVDVAATEYNSEGSLVTKSPGDYSFVIFRDNSDGAEDSASKVQILQEFIVSIQPLAV